MEGSSRCRVARGRTRPRPRGPVASRQPGQRPYPWRLPSHARANNAGSYGLLKQFVKLGRRSGRNEMGDRETVPCDLILTGGSVVTMDDGRRVLEPGAVAITGDRITAVGQPADLQHYRAARVLDCSGKAVLPGFVECHNHMFEIAVRGLGERLEFWRWLADFNFPMSEAITK